MAKLLELDSNRRQFVEEEFIVEVPQRTEDNQVFLSLESNEDNSSDRGLRDIDADPI